MFVGMTSPKGMHFFEGRPIRNHLARACVDVGASMPRAIVVSDSATWLCLVVILFLVTRGRSKRCRRTSLVTERADIAEFFLNDSKWPTAAVPHVRHKRLLEKPCFAANDSLWAWLRIHIRGHHQPLAIISQSGPSRSVPGGLILKAKAVLQWPDDPARPALARSGQTASA